MSSRGAASDFEPWCRSSGARIYFSLITINIGLLRSLAPLAGAVDLCVLDELCFEHGERVGWYAIAKLATFGFR